MVKNIIFDLGGVLLNLDQERTLRRFRKLGLDLDEINIQSPVFKDFETGKIKNIDDLYTGKTHKTDVPTQAIEKLYHFGFCDIEELGLQEAVPNHYYILTDSKTSVLAYYNPTERLIKLKVTTPLSSKSVRSA